MFQRLARYLLLPLVLTGSLQAAETASRLLDLHYGEALFQFYQNNHFDAMVHLLAARQQGRMQAYGEEPELLLGGLYLAYGMNGEAEALFSKVLQLDPAPEIHDRAWLLAAKSRHRRGQADEASVSLAHVGDSLKGDNRSEQHALTGLLALQRSDNGAALRLLQNPPSDGIWSRYVLFNRAIALLRQGRNDEAQQVLRKLDDLDAEDEESKSLRDRANLLLGFLLLESRQPKAARAALERVRLEGLAANQALLGMGWAAMQEGKPEASLPPWQHLSQLNPQDPSVLEAMLAIPYVLSELEADQQSFERYRQVIELLGREQAKLEQTIGEIEQGRLLTLIREEDQPLPGQSADAATELLSLLLTESRFQETLQDYRDLRLLNKNLETWNEKTGTYHAMLEVRQRTYETALPKVEKQLTGEALGLLEKQREELDKLTSQAQSADEPLFSLANANELRLLERLDHLEGLIDRVEDKQELSGQRERMKLLRGVLIWRAVTEHPARRWELTKRLRELDQALEQTRQQQLALARAHQETRGRFLAFADRISVLEEKIPGLLSRLRDTRRELRILLSSLAIEVLQRRKQLLNDYLIQARFGLASLLDRNRTGGAR